MSTPGNPDGSAHSAAASHADVASEQSGGASPEIADRERELARTRAQLGETIEALEAKLDVRSRATRRVRAGRETMGQTVRRARVAATDPQGRPLPAVWAGVGVIPVLLGVVLVLRSRRPRRWQRPHYQQRRRS